MLIYKQDATSHTKSCTSIYSVVIPIQLNREMELHKLFCQLGYYFGWSLLVAKCICNMTLWFHHN